MGALLASECYDEIRPFDDGSYYLCASDGTHMTGQFKCPYGKPGDLLYVREAWAKTNVAPIVETIDNPWTVYRTGDNRTDYGGPWKPGIHMKRCDSRITLRITDVRVERVQDITDPDVVAEGVTIPPGALMDRHGVTRSFGPRWFQPLWDSLNESRGLGWDANPWVWVVSFEVIKQNVDQLPLADGARIRPALFSGEMVRVVTNAPTPSLEVSDA